MKMNRFLWFFLFCFFTKATSNQPPNFLSFQSSYFVPENTSVGSVLGVLRAVDVDDGVLDFRIVGEVARNLLTLVKTSDTQANVELKSQLDRETNDVYEIIFAVDDGTNPPIQKKTTLFVNDVNDNAPTFINLPYRGAVREDALVGRSVLSVSAVDPDSGIWGLVNYELKTKNSPFGVHRASGIVVVDGALDYEKDRFYQIEIVAVDGNGLSSTTDLVVNVIDVQDTPPEFLSLPYVVSVPENTPTGTSIVKLRARDGDRGSSNRLLFSFPLDASPASALFAIDESSGVLSVNGDLDRESAFLRESFGVIYLTVQAVEEVQGVAAGGPTRSTAPVTVTITDVNDEAPFFNAAHFNASIRSDSIPGTPLTLDGRQMRVRDRDQGDFAKFSVYAEKDGRPFELVQVVPEEAFSEANLLLKLRQPLRLQRNQTVTFQVVARETQTAERRSGRTTVRLHLQAANNDWPHFDRETFEAQLFENSPRGTPVTVVNAKDEDEGAFGEVTYFLRGNSAKLFRIDKRSGAVSVAVAGDRNETLLDRESRDVLYLTVEAVDGGGFRSSAQLAVRLLDRNDHAPKPAKLSYDAFVKENQLEMERSLQITATDQDFGANAKLTYSLGDSRLYENFTVNPSTGIVSLRRPLDFEQIGVPGIITVPVVVTDGGEPALSATTTVQLIVEDVNDERPAFSQQRYEATVPENAAVGHSVLQLRASDGDAGQPNNEMRFRLDRGERFRIDALTGVIRVDGSLDRELYGSSHTLSALVVDRGTPALTGSSLVTVHVSDVNNKPPSFAEPNRRVSVGEDAPVGTIVSSLSATDTDVNALLRYEITSVRGENALNEPINDARYLWSLLVVNNATGVVTVASPMDRERVSELHLSVQARDIHGDVSQTAEATLSVTLLDVDDNSPVFVPSSFYRARVSEAAEQGMEVKLVRAVDPDHSSGQIRYRVTDGGGILDIPDALSGLVTLARPVDRETTPFVNVSVEAVDASGSRSTARLFVTVEDVNDNSPQWVSFPPSLRVPENAPIGKSVGRVSATDRDSGTFGRVGYFLTAGGDGKFQIDRNSGVITSTAPLDRERVPRYQLTVEARDNLAATANEQRKTPGYVSVELDDINDQAPSFERDEYSVDGIAENVAVGTTIVSVRATDEDSDSVLQYFIDAQQGNSSKLFSVDQTSGQVFVARSLTGSAGVYRVVVAVRDAGTPPLIGRTNVNVNIRDVNDRKPRIVEPPENATVTVGENFPAGQFVTQVVARDEDSGLNGEVNYVFVQNPSNPERDWLKFNINRRSGVVSTTRPLDRETQTFYFLEVRAFDLGEPSYEDRHVLRVEALDADDNVPTFDRENVPTPLLLAAPEERTSVYVGNVSRAKDADSGENGRICYFVVGGDERYRGHFRLSPTSGELFLQDKVDRERTSSVDLVIKATQNCSPDVWRNRVVTWDPADESLLLVRVDINDINDNVPRFTKPWFTAGVTRDTDFGSPVINLMASVVDPDTRRTGNLSFFLKLPMEISEPLSEQLAARDQAQLPFRLNANEGIIRSNAYFQSSESGYFRFRVSVNDSSGSDFANVSIYLLNDAQRVKVTLRGAATEVGNFRDHFASFLSNITGSVINVGKIQTHEDGNGKPDEHKTDMYLHAVEESSGQVLHSKVLIDLIDRNYGSLVQLFKQYNVIEIMPAQEVATASTLQEDLRLALILIACLLLLLLLLLCCIFCLCRKRYKRKLKAANAIAFGGINPSSGLKQLEMPGTNIHSFEGSNPIWLEQYDRNGWVARESDSDSRNSLDLNAIETTPGELKTYDEQEMSLPMFNDELDNFNRLPGKKVSSQQIFVQQQQAHKRQQQQQLQQHGKEDSDLVSNDLNAQSGGAGSTLERSNIAGYRNYSFEGELAASETTRHINDLITTDI